jgi:DNA-binding NtrC family response regulator
MLVSCHAPHANDCHLWHIMPNMTQTEPPPERAFVTKLPELVSFLEGLSEPHILFDAQYRILAANAAYTNQFRQEQSVMGRTCYEVSHRFTVPCDQAGETCPLAKARESGQREHVMHLHHTPKGEEYINIELTPIFNAARQQTYYVEKMVPLRVAMGRSATQGLIGRSAAFQEMLALVARVAPSLATVLLLGESGTGKELVAQAVHESSTRAHRPLVVVDCASMPENLFESELFGHERGAFTGANTAREGLVEAASGGTLFLDEVGDIPLTIQVKLLRLLESGTYRRVGSSELRHADIRVVSATHRNIAQMVSQGLFREDLYYRLSTFPIHLPALRERRDDIPILSAALLARIGPKRNLALTASAQRVLQEQGFPGNVRELRNLLERASLLCDGEILKTSHLTQALQVGFRQKATVHPADASNLVSALPARNNTSPNTLLKDAERSAFLQLVEGHIGSRIELAQKLGISARSLYRKLNSVQ